MSADKNRETAIKLLRSMGHGVGYDESLVTDDFCWWGHGVGTLDKHKFKELGKSLKHIMPDPPVLEIIGTTSDGDRVAVEANGDCMLANGVRYQNKYHWVVLFRDGKVKMLKEYYDSKYANDCIGAALNTIPRENKA